MIDLRSNIVAHVRVQSVPVVDLVETLTFDAAFLLREARWLVMRCPGRAKVRPESMTASVALDATPLVSIDFSRCGNLRQHFKFL